METKILKIDGNSLIYAKELLQSGELVAFPTETVYGLGANAMMEEAVAKTFKVKGRPQDNPLICHLHPDYDLEKLVKIKHSYVYDLIDKFVPGPLTMVFESRGVVAKNVSCGLDTLAIRYPKMQESIDFLKFVDMPISAPSANKSTHVSPVTAKHVYDDLKGEIPLILDGGRSEGGIESTVINVMGDTPIILRAGIVTYEDIVGVTGKCLTKTDDKRIISPGTKYKHYSPKCPAKLFMENEIINAKEYYFSEEERGEKPIILCENKHKKFFCGLSVFPLGENLKSATSNLYYALRRAEDEFSSIIAIAVEEKGLGVGIMNRLKKSCGYKG